MFSQKIITTKIFSFSDIKVTIYWKIHKVLFFKKDIENVLE